MHLMLVIWYAVSQGREMTDYSVKQLVCVQRIEYEIVSLETLLLFENE